MKPTSILAESARTPDERQHLISWKEIAEYMRLGVRTVQRYEREFGLPVRRPTGKTRGSVVATKVEIDAWIAAGPIRETFRLLRVERNSRIRTQADKLEDSLIAMQKLKEQMQALRLETRTALNMLINRVSAFHSLMPSARPNGYEPLINMDMDIDMDDMDKRLYADGSKSGAKSTAAASGHNRRGARRRNNPSLPTTQKPH